MEVISLKIVEYLKVLVFITILTTVTKFGAMILDITKQMAEPLLVIRQNASMMLMNPKVEK